MVASGEAGVVFYGGAERSAALEQLLHFLRFSDALLVLTGAPGCGRSFLCQRLCAALPVDWQLCYWRAAGDSDELWTQVLQDFGAAEGASGAGKPYTDELATSLRQADRGQPRVLVVDDAHGLDDATLVRLAELARDGGAGPLLHLVLSGDDNLDARLASLLPAQQLRHSLALPPLSLNEVGEYVALKWSQRPPLDHADLDRLWRESGGVPARIDAGLARVPALELDPGSRRSLPAGLPVAHMVGVVVLLTGLFVGWLYRDAWLAPEPQPGASIVPSPPNEASPRSLVSPPPPATATAEVPEVAVLDPDSPPALAETAPEAESAPAAALTADASEEAGSASESLPLQARTPETMVQNVQTTAEGPDTDAGPEVPVAQTPAGEHSGATGSAQIASSPEAEIEAKVEAKVEAVTAPRDPASAAAAREAAVPAAERVSDELSGPWSDSEAYLLSLPDDHYVLQVLAAASRRSVDDFVARQGGGERLHVYTTRRRERPWYVVVTRGFGDVRTARTHRQQLSEELQELGPWLRPIAEIKSEIRLNRDI